MASLIKHIWFISWTGIGWSFYGYVILMKLCTRYGLNPKLNYTFNFKFSMTGSTGNDDDVFDMSAESISNGDVVC